MDTRGSPQLDDTLATVHAELRRLAARHVERDGPSHTLQPTALVHEAYLQLAQQRTANWTNRAQFVALAAGVMRRVLVNEARDHAALDRGGVRARLSLGVAADTPDERGDVDLIALHGALDQLEMIDAQAARIVELRYFGGLSVAEVADVLGISRATAEAEWRFARAWLFAERG